MREGKGEQERASERASERERERGKQGEAPSKDVGTQGFDGRFARRGRQRCMLVAQPQLVLFLLFFRLPVPRHFVARVRQKSPERNKGNFTLGIVECQNWSSQTAAPSSSLAWCAPRRTGRREVISYWRSQ